MTALTPLAIIAAYLPKMAADAAVATFITLAEQRTGAVNPVGGWNEEKRAQAVAYRAMHMWALSKTRPLGEAGAVQSKREGELSLGFAGVKTSRGVSADPDLEQTAYGRALIGLIKGTFIPMGIAGTRANDTDWNAALWGED